MKILFVTSECAPFSKSGGLADVAFSLPPALQQAGNEVAIITPLYQCVRDNYEKELTRIKDKTIRFQGQKDMRIVLAEALTALDEVVVVGYGTLTKKEMTSAISHVSSKDLNHVTSLDSRMLLQGKVSSVTVDNSATGDPNSQGNIQIRGVSSRQAGTGHVGAAAGHRGDLQRGDNENERARDGDDGYGLGMLGHGLFERLEAHKPEGQADGEPHQTVRHREIALHDMHGERPGREQIDHDQQNADEADDFLFF